MVIKKRCKRVHLCKISKKIEFYYQLVVAPPVVTICVFVLLMVTRSKLVRSEIN